MIWPAPLPRDTVRCNGETPRCPWCGAYVDASTVTLEDLLAAFASETLGYPPISTRGALQGGLRATCTYCAKPFAIALRSRKVDGLREVEMRLLAVRTQADLKYLAGEGAW